MLYMNRETGEVLTKSEMKRQFIQLYDGGDETNMLEWDEYFDEVYEGKSIRLATDGEIQRVIETREPRGRFYRRVDTAVYIGVDNTTGEAWVEEFNDKMKCFDWLVGKENVDE